MMPYSKISDLPDNLKSLPDEAKKIYLAAFNSAYESHKGDEEASHKIAWAAVQKKYKKDGDNWVARESSVDQLQAIYSSILLESGRRSLPKGENKAIKFLESCRILLDTAEPSADAIVASLGESNEVLQWLKTQETIKHEDGSDYPVRAYAYAPDSDSPSEWKLRLWEDNSKKTTRT
jgi:cation transport regulator